jgi:hypothetical protein
MRSQGAVATGPALINSLGSFAMSDTDLTKRAFLQVMGASLPAVQLVLGAAGAPPQRAQAASSNRAKFTPLDCTAHFNASAADLGRREQAKDLTAEGARDALVRTPSGSQRFRGIPFELGPGSEPARKAWIALARANKSWTASRLEIPVGRAATFLCLAQFCDWDPSEKPEPDSGAFEKAGQELARLTLVYEDDAEHAHPIRRRFEVNSLSVPWGHLCFCALPHRQDAPRRLTDPLRNAMDWGDLQMAAWSGDYPGASDVQATLWISAIENPAPERMIKSLRFEAGSEDPVFLCGATLFHGKDNPLRYERLAPLRIELPKGTAYEPDRWTATVDLGVIARTYPGHAFEADRWLSSPSPGLGEVRPAGPAQYFMIELAASPEATLTVEDSKTGHRDEFPMRQVYENREPAARVQFLDRERTWLHGRVTDRESGRLTPVRIAFQSSDGRYIPPYGHRTEINASWFQDYGADIKMADSSFAYVDGNFQIELPVGEVFVEVSKGFEYEPIRKKLRIEGDQGELNLEIGRFFNLRARNWVSADTHVHFLSPSTAVLEGQAEGLNLINLLAAQWGDLFTNVGDLPHGHLSSSDGDMLVCPGTENRQHILGHIGMLGTHANPVFPMSSSSPEEGYLGNPLWRGLCEWADTCREREGLAVAVHFPYPTGELAAAIALGKIDAVELWPEDMSEHFDNLRFQEWYRYLNCGYRLPAVAGTDKMGAWVPAGAYRAYAQLGADEFSFKSWAKAVRSGNTFMSSGPLLLFEADGRAPGSGIRVTKSGASIEVRAEARSAVPIHRLEIMLNGRIAASREENAGAKEIMFHDTVRVEGPGWIAARCASRLSTPGFRVAAHTSPVYLTVPGTELFSAPVAAYMLTLIDGSEAWASQLATRPDPAQFQRILQVFKDARARVHARMHQHVTSGGA